MNPKLFELQQKLLRLKYPETFKVSTKNKKILHPPNKNRCLNVKRCNSYFLEPMDFKFRKILKANGIKYTFYRKKKLLVVESPFHFWCQFDEQYGSVTIRRTGYTHYKVKGNLQFELHASTVLRLWEKMLKHNIITPGEFNNLKFH